jgi:hypothetical protein
MILKLEASLGIKELESRIVALESQIAEGGKP